MMLLQQEQSMLQGSLKQNQDPLGSNSSFLNIKQWRKMDTGTEELVQEGIYARAALLHGSAINGKIMKNWHPIDSVMKFNEICPGGLFLFP